MQLKGVPHTVAGDQGCRGGYADNSYLKQQVVFQKGAWLDGEELKFEKILTVV